MAYLNTVSTDFFAEDLNASPPRFKLYKNQGVANYVDYEVFGIFAGRGALRFENFNYPSTPLRIFRIFASGVSLPLQASGGGLKLTPPDDWSGKEIRVKVLAKGESGSDGFIAFDLGGDTTNTVKFGIQRYSGNMQAVAVLFVNGNIGGYTNLISFPLNNWFLVDFQAKINFSTNNLQFKVVVYPVFLNADGTFNSLGTPIDMQTTTISFSSIPSPNTLWGVNPFEVQGIGGNPQGIWLDNLSIGQGERIMEL
jgi:hypothetical protein